MKANRPIVGGTEWERAGGPALSWLETLSLLGKASRAVVADLAPRLWWRLGLLATPRKVDLAAWAPPDTRAARNAEAYVREVSSEIMVGHSMRAYYFAGVTYELARSKVSIDREALYVAAVLHDVGLFEIPRPATDHCFTVTSAREARRIAKDAGWSESRMDSMALAITANLNGVVPLAQFGPEAHFFTVGGLVEVIAQGWKVHPDNAAEILTRYPRDGFVTEAVDHFKNQARRTRGCRFGRLQPVLPFLVKRLSFSPSSSRPAPIEHPCDTV